MIRVASFDIKQISMNVVQATVDVSKCVQIRMEDICVNAEQVSRGRQIVHMAVKVRTKEMLRIKIQFALK